MGHNYFPFDYFICFCQTLHLASSVFSSLSTVLVSVKLVIFTEFFLQYVFSIFFFFFFTYDTEKTWNDGLSLHLWGWFANVFPAYTCIKLIQIQKINSVKYFSLSLSTHVLCSVGVKVLLNFHTYRRVFIPELPQIRTFDRMVSVARPLQIIA